ncbi:hypothetical protein BS50DRAFT_632876 [Corynespora cassiicola Philippines]|uniref:Rhodopsin domain-containing protein n=1 Tax=Corynespora cassiicola Philippines TaxID=1448308 RepID=A0A2T2NUE5_CORCC|nr:hypothetical protein BS50DRAFT_632876 [Corynespora cassiicola Philippines]
MAVPLTEFIASNVLLSALATAFVASRFISKRMKRLRPAVDDVLVVFALVYSPSMPTSNPPLTVDAGVLGHRMLSATPGEVERTLVLLWLLQFPYAAAMAAVQVSISLFCLRTFFTRMMPKLRGAAYGCIAFNVLWFAAFITLSLLHCRPLKYNWSMPFENSAFCFPIKPFTISMAALGIMLDLVIWTLPHFVVWKLNLRLVHKLAITAIFALGLLNMLTGTFRITSLIAVEYNGALGYNPLPAMLWAVAQVSTAIILACCPLLRPLFERCIPLRLARPATTTIIITTPTTTTICVTTRIEIHDDSGTPRTLYSFNDGLRDDQGSVSHGPTFEVERGAESSSSALAAAGTARD